MLVSNGNKKIGKDTLIFNITSATNCPSKAFGMCKIAKKCYAMKAERLYPSVLPFRERQTKLWDSLSAEEYAQALKKEIYRHKKIPVKFIRFSEAGDFRDQNDVDKLIKIAQLLEDTGVILYGYTARKDLDYSKLPYNLVLTGSNFMLDNMFTPIDKKEASKYPIVCPGDCRKCNMCKRKAGLDIKVKIH